jgi:hypothetical protein
METDRNPQTMIAALASSAKAPELKRHRGQVVPVFPVDFDWDEQRRVERAFFTLLEDNRTELWEELLKHFDDSRYALTMCRGGNPVRNFTVGDLCRFLAERRVHFASGLHSDPNSRGRPDIYLELGIDDLEKWLRQRPGKSLVDLQIEICEKALMAVADKNLTPEARDKFTQRVRMQLSELRTTGQPIFTAVSPDHFDFFNEARAAEIRDDVAPLRK